MKKFTISTLLLMLLALSSFGQGRSITGTVTSSEDGSPLPGVTVLIKGTQVGTITDAEGKYQLNLEASTGTIQFSFIGMVTRELKLDASTNVYDVEMKASAIALDDVVVTALGISRERKALGYAVQDVDGEVLKKSAETNVINALSGRAAGVYVNSSNGNVGASSRIIIRGNQSLKGDNQPLFVVDGVPIDNSIVSTGFRRSGGEDPNTGFEPDLVDMGTGASDINPNDIETMTVLKGGSAAALYGSRGANGVILITTKSGTKKGFLVEVENSTTFSNPLLLPDFQNEYGQGGGGQFWYEDGLNGGKNDGVDESFGPRLDYVIQPEDIVPGGRMYWAVEAGFPQTPGQILSLPQFDSPVVNGVRQATPWISHPDNVKSYYETGVTAITNVAVSNGGTVGKYASLTDQLQSEGDDPEYQRD